MGKDLEPYDFEIYPDFESHISEDLEKAIINEFRLPPNTKLASVLVTIQKDGNKLPQKAKPGFYAEERPLKDVTMTPERGRSGFSTQVTGSDCELKYVGGKPRLFCWPR